MFVRKIRKTVFVTSNVFLRMPIWLILFLLRPFRLFDYLFLVYPGNEYDLNGYCPPKLARSWLFSGKPVIGGIISKGSTGVRGLILVIPNTAKQLLSDKSIVLSVIKRLDRIAGILGIDSIAMAGQLPSIVEKHEIALDSRFVNGKLGTVFTIESTLEKVLSLDAAPKNPEIAIVGTGFIGAVLLQNQINIGRRATGFSQNSEVSEISTADIVIVLTPRGKDFTPYIPHLKDGAIVIDDTHPRIFARLENATLYKVAMSLDGVRFMPKLPGYRNNWVPGCAIEAILQARFGHDTITNPGKAKEAAATIGLRPILVH